MPFGRLISCPLILQLCFGVVSMPAPTNVIEFLDLLQCSQLLSDSVLQKVKEQVPSLCDEVPSPERLARAMLKGNLLTAFQAQRLLSGASEGFYLGKYKLLDLLGRGGMGKVYLAEQITMQRLVALKVIARVGKNRGDTMARFAREAKAVAALNHPNIIQAYDFDELDGIPYISMEFVEGIDAGYQIENHGAIGWAQAADYCLQAALGLEAARKAGFVHRDVKPGNLLIDRDGVVKILDLGLAVSKEERRNDSLTTCQDQIGTVDFMAPEQAIDSHNVDTRADIYALGGVFYFLATRQLSCPGKSSAEKLLKHQNTPPQPIGELVKDIPEELAKLIHRMLAKKREDRPQTPAEVAEALKPFAQRQTPPFDLKVLKNTRESLAPLLGRSPDFAQINVRGQMAGIVSPIRGDSGERTSGASGTSRSGSSASQTSASRSPTMVSAKGAASIVNSRVQPKSNSNAAPQPVAAEAAATAAGNGLIRRQPSGVASKGAPSMVGNNTLVLSPTTVRKKLSKATIVIIPQPEPDDEFAIQEEEFGELSALPSLRIAKKKKTSKKPKGIDPSLKMMIGGGVSVAALLVGLVVWMGGASATPDLSAAITAPPVSAASANVAPSARNFIRLPLESVANVVSTKGMFNDEASDLERLVLPDWNSRDVNGVPFNLINPQGSSIPNMVMLHGTQGQKPPKMPKQVSVSCNRAAKAIHLLSGVGGYCSPKGTKGAVTMVVRLRYASGAVEEHELLNGEHFADYIGAFEVPASQLAFNLRTQQMRFLTITPRRPESIQSIEFAKPAGTESPMSPMIMAVTVEELSRSAANTVNSAAPMPPPSYENWLAFSNEFKNDPDLIFYYTFSGDGDGGDVVRSQATKPKYGSLNAKVFGAKWKEGRFAQKKGLQFEGNGSGHHVALNDNDSNICNFTTSFSVGVWFRADMPPATFQNLISKGDNTWRLQRYQTSEKLELGTNITATDPVTKKADYSKGKLTFSNSLSSIDDRRWHFAVAVYDLNPKKCIHRLYFDGNMEGVAEFEKLNSKPDAVFIGANSQTVKYDPRTWGGMIDEAFIINRALAPADVLRMYAASRPNQ